MEKFTLNRDDCALFVIDMQERLLPAVLWQEEIIKNNEILLKASDKMNFPHLATEQYPQGLGRTVEELLPLIKEENIFAKNCFTAYTEEVKNKLAEFGKKKIILSGSETHICVFQTTRDLIAAGYEVFVVKDAVSSRTKENYLNGLHLMQDMGAVISNTETVIFDLLKVSGTEEFKFFSKLIK